ncbi:ribonuclease H-like domain-containing protein [Lentinula novae-zelandiae]|nr:ribonuclease H-like domain-containing protein [Lentinula novae-zelandiae]
MEDLKLKNKGTIEYPDSNGKPDGVLEKWVEDIADGCAKVIQDAGQPLPDITASLSEAYKKRKERENSLNADHDDYMTKRRKLRKKFENLELEKKSTSKRGARGKETISHLAVKYTNTKNSSSSFGCIAEKCDWLQNGNVAQDCLLKHAADCKHLSAEDKAYAVSKQANDSLGAKVANQTSSLSPASSSHVTDAPSIKQGDTDKWREFMALATNSKYKVTSSSTFADKHIPKEAARIHQEMIKILQGYHHLTFYFDGNNTRGHESVYTGHFTTPDRQTFLFCGYEGTMESHTQEWIKDHIFWSLDEVGRGHSSHLCSDSTTNTKGGKALAKTEEPTLSALPDCVHHISLTIEDITKLEEFQPMLDTMKTTICHFSHSDSATKKLEPFRQEEGVTEGLVTIGKTRFATHYSAAVALDRCFPFIRDLIIGKEINIKNKNVMAKISGRLSSTNFQLQLAQYIQIVGPLACSLWSLEAAQTNTADGFLFWLAMGAELTELFELDQEQTEIKPELARIFNSRYKAFIDQTPDDPYFTMFYLSPHKIHELRYSQKALKETLQNEINFYKKNPTMASIAPLMEKARSARVLAEEFVPQLLAFSCQEYPFTDPLGEKSELEWWKELALHPKARTLAFLCIKGFSALANSMADERSGSRLTYLNSPLCNCQKVDTLINMMKIRQWYGTHQKPKKTQAKPMVTFRDVSDLTGTSQSNHEFQGEKVIDMLDAADEQEYTPMLYPESAFEDGIQLYEEINLGSEILKQVLPKDKLDPSPILAGLTSIDTNAMMAAQKPSINDEDIALWRANVNVNVNNKLENYSRHPTFHLGRSTRLGYITAADSSAMKDSPLNKIPENNLTILDPEHIIQAFLRLLVKLDTTLYVDISFER